MLKFIIALLLFLGLEGYILYKSDEANASVTFQQAKQVWSVLQNKAGYHVNLHYDDDINSNAYNNYKNIYITQGMLDDLKNIDQLTMVLGHELSHFIHQDYRVEEGNSNHELNADKLGYYYCSKLANKFKCLSFLKRMKAIYGEEGNDGVHPTWTYRYNKLKNL